MPTRSERNGNLTYIIWHVAVDMNNFGICGEKEKLCVFGAKPRLGTGPRRQHDAV